MPEILSHNSAFAFLSWARDSFDEIEDQTKQFSVAPLLSIAPTFIYLDKVGAQHSMVAFYVHWSNQTKPKRQRE